jgi:hypothetical protein
MVVMESCIEGKYTVKMNEAERHLVDEIAKAYCIPRIAAITAIVNRGLDSIGKQIKKNEANRKFGKLTPDADHGGD